MRRIVLALMIATLPSFVRAADDDAKAVSQALLDKGAALFSDKDAPSLAKTYTDDAELVVVLKSPSETKTEVKRGLTEIEDFYRSLFKNNDPIRAKNTVEYAHYIGPDLLMIAGVFEVTQGETLQVRFVQIREKRGDSWKIHHLRAYHVGH